jgi:hypothetical protein
MNLLITIILLYLAYRELTRPQIEKKYIIRNQIQAIVDAQELMNSSDKIMLMKKQLDTLDPDEIPQWQKDAYIKAVNEKLKTDNSIN